VGVRGHRRDRAAGPTAARAVRACGRSMSKWTLATCFHGSDDSADGCVQVTQTIGLPGPDPHSGTHSGYMLPSATILLKVLGNWNA
jgi:hypothetical protein